MSTTNYQSLAEQNHPKGLLKGDNEAFGIYDAYTALVYAVPVFSGK